MLRAIREIQPRWVVGENVRGLTNWNGGVVFDEVQADLEVEGYEITPFLLPACAVNAPHRRDRIWFVAHSNLYGSKQRNSNNEVNSSEGRVNALSNTNQSNGNGDVADTDGPRLEHGNKTRNLPSEKGEAREKRGESSNEFKANGNGEFNSANSYNEGFQGSKIGGSVAGIREKSHQFIAGRIRPNWENFPTVAPIRMRDDGVSNKLLRFVVKEFYDTISYTSQENRIKNLQEVWKAIQSEKIWEQIRGFYSLESKNVLFQTMQLYSSEWHQQGELSSFSEELCQPILQHLSKYKEFRCSPQGQELEKQRFMQFGNTLSFLPHEVALAARRFETAIAKFESWHRNESIKAGGNAIVPQVVYQIFKAIEQYERISTTSKSS